MFDYLFSVFWIAINPERTPLFGTCEWFWVLTKNILWNGSFQIGVPCKGFYFVLSTQILIILLVLWLKGFRNPVLYNELVCLVGARKWNWFLLDPGLFNVFRLNIHYVHLFFLNFFVSFSGFVELTVWTKIIWNLLKWAEVERQHELIRV